MFTGIVDHCGIVCDIQVQGTNAHLRVQSTFEALTLGESIAVNGACLTVTNAVKDISSFDVSAETLKLTNLGQLQPGAQVNLERAMRLSDRLGGHLVTGHVDQIARVAVIEKSGDYVLMGFEGTESGKHLLVKKGSVAVNGVSLTVNEVGANGFQVMLIPHTLERTNLNQLKLDSVVNIEFDWMTKIIVNYAKDVVERL